MNKTRVRVNMNTGTRVMDDSRTRRRRTRGDEERAYISDILDDDECDGTCRAGQFCVQHGDLVPPWAYS